MNRDYSKAFCADEGSVAARQMAANEATLKPKEMDLTAYQMAHFEQLLMRRLDEIINECENLDQMVQKLEAEVEKASALGKKSI